VKMTGVTAIAVAMTAVCAGESTPPPKRYKVAVCSELGNGFTIAKAQLIATGMFSAVGVRIDWRRPGSCPSAAIRIDFSYLTDPALMPGSLAYARLYEGIHIVIFYDRIQQRNRPAAVLAHVMVHEIAHILQGEYRHSESGIMKATWGPEDFAEMAFRPLAFTPEDVDLIYRGLEARELRIPSVR
jgi:hypothetical protein